MSHYSVAILPEPFKVGGGTASLRGGRRSRMTGEPMESITPYLPYIVLALGGAIGGNILGALTRGGGGFLGRTVTGAVGGVAAGYGAPMVAPDLVASLGTLIEGENGAHLGNLITGAAGGGVLGLIGGLLIRPRG